jgi:GGDEF domain-containing protein
MDIFDRIEPSKVDRRDAQLWVLAIAMILILSGGLALLAYPAIFSGPVEVSGPWVRRVFMGFCALSLLLIGYLIDRQVTIRRLRSRLQSERTRAARLLSQASADLLETLPRFEHFQDRLAMEFRRAVSLQQPLSLLIVQLKFASGLGGLPESSTAIGDAAKAMVRKLRGEDSMYLFSMGVFGVLLPGVRGMDAHRVSDRLADGLHDASGAGNRFSFEVRVVNYPEHVAAAREMEQTAKATANVPEFAA